MIGELSIPFSGCRLKQPSGTGHGHATANRRTIGSDQPVGESTPGSDAFGNLRPGALHPPDLGRPVAGVNSATRAGVCILEHQFGRELIGILRRAFVAPHVHRRRRRTVLIQAHEGVPMAADADNSDVADVLTGLRGGFLHTASGETADAEGIAHAATIGGDLQLVSLPVLGIP